MKCSLQITNHTEQNTVYRLQRWYLAKTHVNITPTSRQPYYSTNTYNWWNYRRLH